MLSNRFCHTSAFSLRQSHRPTRSRTRLYSADFARLSTDRPFPDCHKESLANAFRFIASKDLSASIRSSVERDDRGFPLRCVRTCVARWPDAGRKPSNCVNSSRTTATLRFRESPASDAARTPLRRCAGRPPPGADRGDYASIRRAQRDGMSSREIGR